MQPKRYSPLQRKASTTIATSSADGNPPKRRKPFDTLATLHNVPAHVPQPSPSTNVRPRFPQKSPPVDGVKNVRNQTRIVERVGKKNHLPLKLFGPTNGRCMNPDCNGTVTGRRNNTNLRMVLTDKLPYYVQGVELQCDKCDKSFQSLDKSYVDTPPMETQSFLDAVIPGKSVGIQMSLVRRHRNGAVASEIEQSCRANVRAWHSSSKRAPSGMVFTKQINVTYSKSSCSITAALSFKSPTLGGRHGLYCRGVGVAGGVDVGVSHRLLSTQDRADRVSSRAQRPFARLRSPPPRGEGDRRPCSTVSSYDGTYLKYHIW